eukprot:symbB.v1.2.000740.t1/scaffold36.1/size400579/12
MSETISQNQILRHVAAAAQDARREHALVMALRQWYWKTRIKRLADWQRQQRCQARLCGALRRWRCHVLWRKGERVEQRKCQALLRQKLYPYRLRPALRCWAARATRWVQRRTQPLRAMCFARERLLRVAYGAWCGYWSTCTAKAAQLAQLQRQLLHRRLPITLRKWQVWTKKVQHSRGQGQHSTWRHRESLLRKGWMAWRRWFLHHMMLKQRQAEALQFFRRSQRLAALQIMLARQAAQRTAQAQRLVAAWRKEHLRACALKPWLIAWRTQCSRERPKQMGRPSSSTLAWRIH